ncbi:GM16524 [Drosophila sechellia]|uniref:GM16524 n=1 Tax=Drosophila sechellia TaxID=7238 RepID=B4II15_DROSE|nr:GM16524 [Drosophila sechellia]
MAHNTTVQLGGTAFLVCKVSGVDRNQISWIRRRDWHILSSGAQLYTNDERFAILHTPGSNMWTLQIKFVQRRDHGMYECQVSTPTGIISHFVNLQVVVPEAFILGSGELHVDMGSTINLVCIIEKSPTPPQYVYWQKNDRLINYVDSRRDITIETTPGPRTQSRLIIREPQVTDSGNYTCSASNTEPASIYVFVSKGDNMAAISRRKTSSADRLTHIFRSMLAPCLLLNTVVVSASSPFISQRTCCTLAPAAARATKLPQSLRSVFVKSNALNAASSPEEQTFVATKVFGKSNEPLVNLPCTSANADRGQWVEAEEAEEAEEAVEAQK